MFIGLLDTRSDIRQGLLIGIVVTEAIVPWAMISLVIMTLSLMALMWWARSPKRDIFLRTGAAMCVCALSIALGMFGLRYLTGTFFVAGTVLYMGLGAAELMFIQIVIPNWETRGFLRHPKVMPDLRQSAEQP